MRESDFFCQKTYVRIPKPAFQQFLHNIIGRKDYEYFYHYDSENQFGLKNDKVETRGGDLADVQNRYLFKFQSHTNANLYRVNSKQCYNVIAYPMRILDYT